MLLFLSFESKNGVKMKYLLIVTGLLLSQYALAIETEKFQSWSMICGEKGNCSLSQLVTKDKEAKKIILGINVNYAMSKEFPVLMLRFPPQINKDSGIGIKIDDNAAIQLPISECNAKACQSVIKMDDVLMREMKNGKFGQVAFALKNNKQLTLPISLNGFNEAFIALNKKNAQLISKK